jgi:hypothetical protein
MSESAKPTEPEFTILLRRPVSRTERRSCRRHSCRFDRLVMLRMPETGTKREGWAFNFSETGVGLNLPYALEKGEVVVLHLRGRRSASALTLPARVARVTAKEDGTWQIGCSFGRRLETSRLEELL